LVLRLLGRGGAALRRAAPKQRREPLRGAGDLLRRGPVNRTGAARWAWEKWRFWIIFWEQNDDFPVIGGNLGF